MDFTLFPILALELQDMIWAFALPLPRIITISTRYHGRGSGGPPHYSFEADASPIATELLHTCSHSRYIALCQYEPAFESKLHAPIYFNWKTDILRFTNSNQAFSYFENWTKDWSPIVYPEWETKLQHFKMTTSNTHIDNVVPIYSLGRLASLKTITIELRNEYADSLEGSTADQTFWKSLILKTWIGCQKANRDGEKDGDLKTPSITFIALQK